MLKELFVASSSETATGFPNGGNGPDIPHSTSSTARASRCRFVKEPGRWTLTNHCQTSQSISLPQGASLYGNGKVITLAGDPENFESVAIQVSQGSVQDLTIDGSELHASAPQYLAALVVSGPGSVTGVTVRNIHFGSDGDSAVAVEVAAFGADAIAVSDVSISMIEGTGMLLTGDGMITVNSTSVSEVGTGVQVMSSVEAAITGISIDRARIGILASDHARASVESPSTPSTIGVSNQARARVGNLTIIGAWATNEPSRAMRKKSPASVALLREALVQSMLDAETERHAGQVIYLNA